MPGISPGASQALMITCSRIRWDRLWGGGEWAKQVTRTRRNTEVKAAWPKCPREPPGSRCVKPGLFTSTVGRLQGDRASEIRVAVGRGVDRL